MAHTINIFVHGANHLEDVERFGKNDPYAQFTLNFEDKSFFQKTATKKNAGSDVEWDQEVNLDYYNPEEHNNLYVEIYDEEASVDAPIGFAAIPLRQVRDAAHHSYKARYELFRPNGDQKGTIDLTISILKPGQEARAATAGKPEEKGFSELDAQHQHHIKNKRNLERAADAATLLAGVAALAGAKAAYDHTKKPAHEQ
ncbi:hypothetical protein BGX21_000532 [Mortierella sp. AD011]|nr:hypothetical protein BGX20_000392 [Mortierella sp. AD010]KAF9387536.1 hypothetical protein BGX21_000532 [Mortierella sp. AD011]